MVNIDCMSYLGVLIRFARLYVQSCLDRGLRNGVQHYYDEGEGTIVANGRGTYLGLCDVEWDR